MTTLKPEDTLGRYRILRRLGSGAMGDVYLAEDPQIERQLAIKTVRIGEGGPGQVADLKLRLLREAKAAGRLIHPNVVTLFDAGEDRGVLYLAFEYVEGRDLAERIAASAPTLGQALSVVRQTAEALDFAHRRGIVHRDIKPSNILLSEHGEAKVSDFGIAKMLGQSTELTSTGAVIGSPHYMSPEQVRGEQLDGRSDIFSLGAVLYELLTRSRAFDGDTITTLVYQILHHEPADITGVRPDLPDELPKLVRRMMAKDREQRFPEAGEVGAEIRKIEAALPTSVLESPVWDAVVDDGPTRCMDSTAGSAAAPPVAGRGSRRWLAVVASGFVLVALVAAGWVGLRLIVPTEDDAGEGGRPQPRPAAVDSSAVSSVAPPETDSQDRDRTSRDDENGAGDAAASLTAAADDAGAGEATVSAAGETGTSVQPAAQEAPPGVVAPPPNVAAATTSSSLGSSRARAAPVPGAAVTAAAPAAEPPLPGPTTRASEPTHELSAASANPRPPTAPPPSVPVAVDADLATGLALSFKVEPPDAFVLFKDVAEDRYTLIGQAREFDTDRRRGKVLELPGPGEYLVMLRKDGLPDYVLRIRAAAGAASRPISVRLGGARND